MFLSKLSKSQPFKLFLNRQFHLSRCKQEEFENPILRTIRILAADVGLTPKTTEQTKYGPVSNIFPSHADIVIIGGGALGSSIAYWLKEKTNYHAMRVVVIEKDMTFSKCSSLFNVSGLFQHFSIPENIQMAIYGSEFLRCMKKSLGKEANVDFVPHGFLALANEENASVMFDNYKLQMEMGAMNVILDKNELKERFPWMNLDDVELGCFGAEKQGWFNARALLKLLQKRAHLMGVQFIEGEVVDFTFENKEDIIVEGVEMGSFEGLQKIIVKLPNGEHKSIQFAYCILTAGTETPELATLARIGNGPGMLSVKLPIEKRQQFMYKFNCKSNPPGINTPLTRDISEINFRRDCLGGSFICSVIPRDDQLYSDDINKYFEEYVRPHLINRVPAFSDIEVTHSVIGNHSFNYFDGNGIIGPHPYHHNLYMATGFSKYGIQLAPAVGRATAELMLDGNFQTIDLSRFTFDRLIVDKPLFEIY